ELRPARCALTARLTTESLRATRRSGAQLDSAFLTVATGRHHRYSIPSDLHVVTKLRADRERRDETLRASLSQQNGPKVAHIDAQRPQKARKNGGNQHAGFLL